MDLQFNESLVGTEIEGFQITRFLGVGGMGAAFRAIQIDLGRQVCLKFLKSDGLSDRENLERFKREARVLSRLQHPNIVSCYSFGLVANFYPYLVLEYVEGESLRELLIEQKPDWQQVCRIMEDVCNALEHAHQNGFVHRDIKPENIMLASTPEGRIPKIIDFGLAGKLSGCEISVATLTAAGTLMGSVNYMAPESFRGERANRSLDVYAAGCVLYEMISGATPFQADTPMAVMYKHTNEQLPPLQELAAPESVRSALQKLIWRSTEKDPAERLESCAHMAAGLEGVRLKYSDRAPESPKASSASKSPWLPGVCVVLALIAGCGASLYLSSARTQRAPEGAAHDHASSAKQLQISEAVALQTQAVILSNRWNSCVEIAAQRTSRSQLYEQTGQFLDQLQSKLWSKGSELNQTESEMSDLLQKLSDSLGNTGRSLNVLKEQSLASRVVALQCDLAVCFGCYDAAYFIMDHHCVLPSGFRISHQSDQDLVEFIETAWAARKRVPDSWIQKRIRPVMGRCMKFAALQRILPAYVVEYAQRDLWSPDLVSIACELNEVYAIPALSVFAIAEADPERRGKVLERLDWMFSQHPMYRADVPADLLADLFMKVGKPQRAISLLQNSRCRSSQSADYQQYCLEATVLIDAFSQLGRGAECKKTWDQFRTSRAWQSFKSVWLTPNERQPSNVPSICAHLQDAALFSAIYHDDALAKSIESDLQQWLLSKKKQDLGYEMQVYYLLRHCSTLKHFESSYPLAVVLNDCFQAPSLDVFFHCAPPLELGYRQWLRGRGAEGRKNVARAISLLPSVVLESKVGGAVAYVEERIPWLEQMGYAREAASIRLSCQRSKGGQTGKTGQVQR